MGYPVFVSPLGIKVLRWLFKDDKSRNRRHVPQKEARIYTFEPSAGSVTAVGTNIWALNKKSSIKRLLLALQTEFGEGAFGIDTETSQDVGAIYLYQASRPEYRAFVFDFGNLESQLGVQLEYPSDQGSPLRRICHQNLQYYQAVMLLAEHLGLTAEKECKFASG